MKLLKLETALKKAQAAEKSAKAAYGKIVSHTGLISDAWIEAKAKYKSARKELKRMRKESTLTQTAQKTAKRCYEQSTVLLEKLAHKLKKARKKSGAKQDAPRTDAKAKKPKGTSSKKRVASGPKTARKPTVMVPISAEAERLAEPTVAQA